MRSSLKTIFITIKFLIIFTSNLYSVENFNFDITEVEIIEDGNKFKGLKKGTITSNNGIIINANNFIYDKNTNILDANGNIKIIDKENNYTIFSDNLIYYKNDEKIITKGNSKFINNELNINSQNFEYDKKLDQLKAIKNVKIIENNQNLTIIALEIIYDKKEEKLFSKGDTQAEIENKYNIYSENVLFNRKLNEISSNNKTKIYDDKSNLYELSEFKYYKDKYLLKGKDIIITTEINSSKFSETLSFASGFFDLENNDFNSTDTEIKMKKSIFGRDKNDPRLKGVSSSKKGNITKINKGVFTSCSKEQKCPAWQIEAEKIEHNKHKKQLIYDNALLKIYDVPIVYFPKFFHPDPSVKRQSGMLQPVLNNSGILGSSLKIPYFKALSKNKDLTITSNIIENKIFMFENEYREKKENSALVADFGFTQGYKSTISKKKKNISHLFAKYKLNLKLDDFISSDLNINIQKVTNDTYLKVFDSNLSETQLKPENKDQLISSVDFSFEHDDYNFSTGLTTYENLSGRNSDRYQYILPYYNFSKNLFKNQNNYSINLTSSGSNNLKNTNNLRSRIINNISLESLDFITKYGFKNNFKINAKNLNTVAKNDDTYKSSPQIELMSLFEVSSSLPMIKLGEKFDKYIEPKISLRFNPSEMKDYSNSKRKIGVSNIFDLNRLGLTDTLEEGSSITMGLDYRKEAIENINKYFEIKLASVFRNKNIENIPTSSAIKQSGNLIGSVKNSINDNLNFIYDFSLDNDLKTFDYNSVSANLNFNKFSTGIKLIEESGKIGDINSVENSLSYEFDENNFLTFNTRRNKKINLTEFYDLIYEYKNDCLTAGIKYKKTYYQDRDLLPTEDFMISITIFPLTTFEQKFD